MKNRTILVLAAATLSATGIAKAADISRSMGSYSPAYAAYSWMGPYVGANLGYEWGSLSNNPTKPSGLMGGLQAGYNWQSGQLVVGAETDLQISAADNVVAPWKFANPWFGTLRARAGLAANNILFYGTGGFAYGGLRAEMAGLSESKTSTGWTLGGGMEVAFTPNWSAKVEYLYLNLAARAYAVTGTTHGLSANILRFGVNYHF